MNRRIAMVVVLLTVGLCVSFVWSQAGPGSPGVPAAPPTASQPAAPPQPGMPGMGGHMGPMGAGMRMGTSTSQPGPGGMGCPMMGGMGCPMMGGMGGGMNCPMMGGMGPMGPGSGPAGMGSMCPMCAMRNPIVQMVAMIDQLDSLTSVPGKAGLLAIGALKDDIKRKPADVIRDFEALLSKTKSLPLRNAIRLTLKDLYKSQGDDEKALDQMRAMILENDAAIAGSPQPAK